MLKEITHERNFGPLGWFKTPSAQLVPCVYLEITCGSCSHMYRSVMSATPPGAFTPCPGCRYTSSWSLLGTGQTTREMPCHETIDSSGKLHSAKPRIPWATPVGQ